MLTNIKICIYNYNIKLYNLKIKENKKIKRQLSLFIKYHISKIIDNELYFISLINEFYFLNIDAENLIPANKIYYTQKLSVLQLDNFAKRINKISTQSIILNILIYNFAQNL